MRACRSCSTSTRLSRTLWLFARKRRRRRRWRGRGGGGRGGRIRSLQLHHDIICFSSLSLLLLLCEEDGSRQFECSGLNNARGGQLNSTRHCRCSNQRRPRLHCFPLSLRHGLLCLKLLLLQSLLLLEQLLLVLSLNFFRQMQHKLM